MYFLSELLLLIAHILFLILFFCLSFGLGSLFLHLLRLESRDDLLHVSISCGSGAWLLSQCVMGLGFLGLISRPSLFILLSILLLISLVGIRKRGGPLRNLLREFLQTIGSKKPFLTLQRGILFFCLFTLGVCLLGLSLPDLSYDSLLYHLYFPRLYLESGQLQFLPHHPVASAYPKNMEMLYVIGLSFGEEGFARVPNLFFVFLCLLLFGSLAKEISGRKDAGLLTALFFLTLPVVSHEVSRAHVDIGSGFYGIASLSCLIKGHREGNRKWFFIAGLLGAAGIGIKYLYFIQVASLNLVFLWLWLLGPKGKRNFMIASTFLFTGTVLLFGCSWYLRNTLVTKNPAFPLFYSLFNGPYWTRELEKGFLHVWYQFGPQKTFLNFMIMPFTLLKEGVTLFALSPLLILLIKKKYHWISLLGGLCLMEASIWFFLLPFQTRYGIFWLTLLSILIGSALGCILEEKQCSRGFRRLVLFLVACLVIISLRPHLTSTYRSLSIILGLKTREELKLRYVESYAVMNYINEFLPKDAKIASFGDGRGYYCKRPFYPVHPYLSGYIDLNQMRSAKEYYERLKEIGITYLIYNPRRTEIFRRHYPHWIELQQELQDRYLVLILRKNNVSLYKLKVL